ncbi:hypothetical protein AVEN_263038-1, partial [Araneus ventricosus]
MGEYTNTELDDIQRWIDLGDPVRWPARWLDLSCLDFYSWGHMKIKGYETQVHSDEDLVSPLSMATREVMIFLTPSV